MVYTEGRARYLYTASHDSLTYRVLIPKWLGLNEPGAFGFLTDDSTRPYLPRNIKMRYVTAKSDSTARHRKIHCGTETCTRWSTLSVSITLPDINGGLSTYTTVGQIGETFRG